MDIQSIFWIGFFVFVVAMLVLDLGVFNRDHHVIRTKEALVWSGVWIGLAMVFAGILYFFFGPNRALEFLTGYVIEKSLSVDNLFVFIMVFSFFHVKKIYEHKILFWGIIGALVMRAIFIYAGIAVMERFHWIIYVFGAFLVFTGIKMFFESKEEIEFEEKLVVRLLKKVIPISKPTDDGSFFTIQNGKRMATPLFVALVIIELTDLVFALDSIPAILAISNDMFVVYTSNIFAILGLRSLYFALAGLMGSFVYLKYGLGFILLFVGIKMCISDIYHFPILLSLAIILGSLALSVGASYVFPPKEEAKQ